MNKSIPRIYLAGKIDKSDWRHQVVPELRRHEAYLAPIGTNEFIYVGPFFKSCDHGCFHADGSHGFLGQNQKLRRLAQLQVRNACFEAVRNCDIFFLYINHREAFGSLVEIGWAQAFNKKVVVIYAPGIASPYSNDYWFSSITADRTVYGVEACDVRRIIYDVIGDLSLGNTSGCWE